MVDSEKKDKDFLGIPKDDLTLGVAGVALAIAGAIGIKTLTDMQRTGQLPSFFPNPGLMQQQQQQELINQQIAMQAQADAQAQEPEVEEEPVPDPMQAQIDEGVRTVPRRRGDLDRINI